MIITRLKDSHRKALVLLSIAISIAVIGVAINLYSPVALWREPPGSEVVRESVGEVLIETVAKDLEAPWSIDFTSDGDIFFTERPGRVRMIEGSRLLDEPLLELAEGDGEGGLLGIALDPNYNSNRFVYVYYTNEDLTNQVSRYRYNGRRLVEESIIIDGIPGARTHNGGRIGFGPDGNLYIATGDAEEPRSAQDENSLAGKILRVKPNGNIPIDNPRADSPVYSIGHRNVQGLAWDEEARLYATEHGAQALDKINLIRPGANYGWPIHEGDIGDEEPQVENYMNPVLSSGQVTWAPSGATFYTDDSLPSEWQDKLLFAGLRSQGLWRLDIDSLELQKLLDESYGRLRDVQQGPDGYLYILTSNRDGRGQPDSADDRILRIMPDSNN